jgi:hypothetical protein
MYTSSTNFNSLLGIWKPHSNTPYFTHIDFPLISDSSLWQVVEIIGYTKLNYTLSELSFDFLSASFVFVRSTSLLAPVTCGYASNDSKTSFCFAVKQKVSWNWSFRVRPCPAWQRRASTCGRALLPHADKHVFVFNNYLLTYLLMYGAETFLRSCQLCSHSGNSQQF